MSVEIKVPVLGESVTSATVTRWLKQPGQAVAADEPVVELETDKISVEVPAPQAGVLGNDLTAAGAEVAVGSVLGTLDPKGTPSASPQVSAAKTPEKTRVSPAPEAAESHAPMPAAARLMAEEKIAPETIPHGSGLDGRVTKGDVIARMAQPEKQQRPPQLGHPRQRPPSLRVLSPRRPSRAHWRPYWGRTSRIAASSACP